MNWIEYLSESSICFSAMFLLWFVLMRKDTFFRLNRILLISIMILSILIPLIEIHNSSITNYVPVFYLSDIVTNGITGAPSQIPGIDTIFMIIYLIVLLVLLLFYILSFIKLINLIKSSVKMKGYMKIGNLNVPFSFYKFIFIPSNIDEMDKQIIIRHENEHIKKLHYLDRFLADIFSILFWFNPLTWLMKMELKKLHEFEADMVVIKSNSDIENYLKLLFKYSTGVQFSKITINFNFSGFKERVVMMTKKQSPKFAYFKHLLIIPLAVLLFINFSCSNDNDNSKLLSSSNENKQVVSKQQEQPEPKTTNLKSDFVEVDEVPAFKGDLVKELQKNIKYPDDARKKSIQGKVILSLNISEKGTIEKIKIVNSINKQLDDEAVRVASLLKEWKPAVSKGSPIAAKVMLPIVFRLN